MGFSMTVSLIASKLPATPIKGIAIPCPAPMSPRKHLALEQRQDMLCCYGQVKRLAAQRGKRREAWLFFPLAKTDNHGLHRHMCFAGFNLLRRIYAIVIGVCGQKRAQAKSLTAGNNVKAVMRRFHPASHKCHEPIFTRATFSRPPSHQPSGSARAQI